MNEELLVIKRGYVYEFDLGTGYTDKVYALAVSSDKRATDNIISVIVLSKTYGGESIPINNSIFSEGVAYANCGKVTFTDRKNMKKECFKISNSKLYKINVTIASELGIVPQKILAENEIYKEMYEKLLNKMLGGTYEE